jgi:hypothetical protein
MCSDFTDKSILVDFYESLDLGLRSQLTESAFYMGKPGLPLKGSGSLTRCQEQVCKWRDNRRVCRSPTYLGCLTVASSCTPSASGR